MRNYSRCSKLCCLVIATVLSWLFAVSANAQVSMSLKDVSVRSAVEYLQKEYHYSFTIGTDDIDINKHVTVQVKKRVRSTAFSQDRMYLIRSMERTFP